MDKITNKDLEKANEMLKILEEIENNTYKGDVNAKLMEIYTYIIKPIDDDLGMDL